MTFNNQTGRARFFDDVSVTYGQLVLSAQKLTVVQSQNKDNKSNHLKFTASGQIIISSGNNFIYGNEAEFNGENQLLTLNGDVKLHQNDNLITGETLILDLKNGVVKISGSVKTIINASGK